MPKHDSRIGLLEREQEIIRIINVFLDNKLEFVVVGGYAVSTYKKRFSIDLDIVISEKNLEKFEKILEKEKYILSYEKKIELIYGENFKRFRKIIKQFPADIDLLINGLASRATDAAWGWDYIKKQSIKRKIESTEFFIPEKELLIAMKFHSGRLSDIKDIVALMPCNFKLTEKHLNKGSTDKLKNSMKNQLNFLNKSQFKDSFKGIFGPYSFNEKNLEITKDFIEDFLRS
ncbi:MAG: hypothetical protein WD876_04000 [Candidatus Pacearchaeota archaeon]